MIKVGIIIPTRGDRQSLLDNSLRMLAKQTFQPAHIELMADEPKSDSCDITYRYRKGYDKFKNRSIDVIALWEDDDFYCNNYLETMVKEWDKAGRPDLFGTNYTIYYHLKLRKYFTMRHDQRASAMNTLIRPGLNILWPQDHDPYTDQWLWMEPLSGIKSKALFEPKQIISVGMKHASSKVGGGSHKTDLHRFINDDKDMYWLEGIVGEENFKFYKQFSERMISGEIKQV